MPSERDRTSYTTRDIALLAIVALETADHALTDNDFDGARSAALVSIAASLYRLQAVPVNWASSSTGNAPSVAEYDPDVRDADRAADHEPEYRRGGRPLMRDD